MGANNDATLTHDGSTGLTISATPISIDSIGSLDLNSTTGDINFQDGGVNQLSLDLDGTAGEIIMQLKVDSDDFVFKQFDGIEVFRVEDNGDFKVSGGSGSSGVTITSEGNLTIDGTLSDGNYTFDTDGNVSGLGTVGCGAITSSGNVQLNLSKTGVATASDLTWRPFYIPSASLTTTGNTNVTTSTGLNLVEIAAPTIVDDGSNFTVTNSATLYIGGAPSDGGGSGTVTITNPYSVWVDSGVSRFDGKLEARGQFSANTNGSFGTFLGSDTTPSVSTGNLWKTHASTQTLHDFDDGISGQTITVISTAAVTYDVTTSSLGYNLKAGTTNLTTASGDITVWTFDGTNWYLVQFMDQSTNMASGGGGAGAINDLSDAYADSSANNKNLIIGHVATSLSSQNSGEDADYNVALGMTSLDAITTGDNNTAIGYDSLTALISGTSNTALGYQSGETITIGTNNTCIGSDTDVSSNNATNQTAIGYQAICSSDNQVTLGNSSITALRCGETTIASVSDKRDKTNITDSIYGLNFINSIRPVKYTWDKRVLKEGDSESVLNGKTRVGFLAQELQSAMPNNENEILDLVYDVNPERLEAKYGNLIPILTKAIQELSSQNQALTERINYLEKNI